MSAEATSLNAAARPKAGRLADYWELIKPEVTGLVVVSALAGFYLGTSGALDWVLLLHALLGTALVSGGTAAFNMYLEREDDARMRRTARRPLPAGRLQPAAVWRFAALLSAGGILYLALWVNFLSSFLAFAAWASYLFLYTPLKKRTVWCTTVGAFPGAMPPLIGWAAARNHLSVEAWVLYAILFLWQFPHFLSIAWIYRDDYSRARMQMLPAVDPSGRATGRQMVGFTLALLPVALLPALLGLAGAVYFWGALLSGAAFLHFAIQAAVQPTARHARSLLHATVAYVPVVFGLLMLDKQ